MRKAFLKKARETLDGMRTQLLRNARQDISAGRDASKDEGMDTYDLASESRDREINLILSDRERDKIAAIDDALGRIDDGSYGICDACEGEVAEARLVALPFTRLCVNCQADREREAKVNRRFEQDPSFRRLGVNETGEEES
jgi:DnaK suppressor protein